MDTEKNNLTSRSALLKLMYLILATAISNSLMRNSVAKTNVAEPSAGNTSLSSF